MSRIPPPANDRDEYNRSGSEEHLRHDLRDFGRESAHIARQQVDMASPALYSSPQVPIVGLGSEGWFDGSSHPFGSFRNITLILTYSSFRREHTLHTLEESRIRPRTP